MERRLSAILAIDVVGYSRLMSAIRLPRFERLRTHRQELFEPEIASHHGRIFKLTGDGLLAEFSSVVDALECAVSLQRRMAERNLDVPAGSRIDVRTGLHVGDVIMEDDDRLGDAVNVAARLQQFADPGGICVSGSVVDHVRHKVSLSFQSLGEMNLKNIMEPVRVYQVALGQASTTERRSSRLPRRGRQALVALLLALAAGLTYLFYQNGHVPFTPVATSTVVEPARLCLFRVQGHC